MWFRSLANYLRPCSSRRPIRRTLLPATACRLILEALEDRTVPSFMTPVTYPVGAGPEAVVTADLNGDGRLDLVTANAGSNNISVQIGNSGGTFQPAQPYAAGAGPASVAVGDVNGDGNLDVVTANEADNTVSVLLGNGNGTLQPAKNYAVGSQPVSVAIGNFNGKPDIVTANQGDYTVSLLPGNGDGTFGAGQTIAAYGQPVASVAVGDFNADGKLDLAVALRGTDGFSGYYGYYPGYSPAVSVLLGDGSGAFPTGNYYYLPSPYGYPPSSFAPPAVAAADLNGDGKLDLAVTDAGDSAVSVLLGSGDGSFTGPTSFGAWDSPQSVAAADLNGDGKLDLVTANSSDTVSVLPGNGDGSFGTPDLFTIGTYPASVATGDWSGDSLTDVTVANPFSDNDSVLINTGVWPSLQVTATDPGTGDPISSTIAGNSFNLTVTADDPFGNVITSFADTVDFGTWDAQATIIDPATGNSVALQNFTYAFTAADHGTRTFSVDLKTAGYQAITVSDPTAGVTPNGPVLDVNPAATRTFVVGGFQSPINAGQASYFSVTAYDTYGNVGYNYTGTVALSSSDLHATLVDPYTGGTLGPLAGYTYTFSASNSGTAYFYAALNTVGKQLITATDSAITGSQSGIQVNLTATITGPTAGYLNQTLTYTLGTIGEPAGTIFTYKIDWNNDGIVDQTVTGPSGTTVTHAYSAATYTYIGVTAIDPNGLTGSTPYQPINILPLSVAIQTDPAHTSQQMLILTGSVNSDSLVLATGANSNGVAVTFNGYALGTIVPTKGSQFSLVVALGQGGNDYIDASALSVSTVLIGGAGNDYLHGGTARNMLIGGLGADNLYAGSAGDILIGGYTSYDNNMTALANIMAEWNRTDVTYATRVKQLSGSQTGGLNGSYLLKSTTVLDDSNSIDVLNGGAGMDWYIVHRKGKHADKVVGQTSGEVITQL
jgi:hypothetical protein